MSWQQPKTNWDTHPKAIEPADLNRMEKNIEVVREQADMPLNLEVVTSFPAHVPGRAVYHVGNNMAYVSDGTKWLVFAAENRGGMIFTPGAENIPVPRGYHDGTGYVKPNQTGCVFNQQNRSYADVSFSLTIPPPFSATITICFISAIKFSSSHLARTRYIYVNNSLVASETTSRTNVLNAVLTNKTGTLGIRGTAARVEDDIEFLYLMAIAKW